MTKVAYCACYGGFRISKAAADLFLSLAPEKAALINARGRYLGERHDETLVTVVEQLGTLADGPDARLRVCDIGDATEYRIEEYEGYENVITRETDTDWVSV